MPVFIIILITQLITEFVNKVWNTLVLELKKPVYNPDIDQNW